MNNLGPGGDSLITLLILAIIFYKLIGRSTRSRKGKRTTGNNKGYKLFRLDIGNNYQRAKFLTQNEYRAYFALKEITDRRGLIICPKVRLLDIVEPKYGISNRKALLNRVMSKHVDFVVCTPDMQIYAIVELDDVTHQRPDRIQRDKFVDSVLNGVGYPIIHTYGITSDIFDNVPGNYQSTIQTDRTAQPTEKDDIPQEPPERTWYPTGWTYNKETHLWDPPDYLVAEASKRWVWNSDKGIWEDRYKSKK